MKKNGFTLAEVLITLAIIGVVATLTLPALMNNTAEQQYKTAFKKGLNTLTIAAETNDAVDGFDFSGTSAESTVGATEASETPSLYALLATRGSVDYALSGKEIDKGGVNLMKAKGASTTDSGNFCVYFRDGSVLMFPSSSKGTEGAAKVVDGDGLPHGLPAIFDVNGPKLPNALSNCDKDANRSSTTASTEHDVTKCTKANRVIKDRFEVRLRGHYAVPNSAAARWANEN